MKVIRTVQAMQKSSYALRRRGKTIGFVATMGALHEGHISLIRQAKKENDVTAVSIFVNPIQFGPTEDFKRYPRPFQKDARLCKKEGVDFIFYPRASELYPAGFKTAVSVKDLSDVLCGASRKNHFCGVTTVVAKLLNIVQPDIAYFGQKDAQQAIIIKRMVRDLNMLPKIKVMPTVREQDGLALSSRNIYLNKEQRHESVVLSKALKLAREMIRCGQRNAATVIQRMRSLIRSKKSARIEYVAIVDTQDLSPLERIEGGCLIALAVRFGKTRLIDNLKIGDASHFFTRARLRKK